MVYMQHSILYVTQVSVKSPTGINCVESDIGPANQR
jgi:hypothetical protein